MARLVVEARQRLLMGRPLEQIARIFNVQVEHIALEPPPQAQRGDQVEPGPPWGESGGRVTVAAAHARASRMLQEMMGASLIGETPFSVRFRSRQLRLVEYVAHGNGNINIYRGDSPMWLDHYGLDVPLDRGWGTGTPYERAALFATAVWLDEIACAAISCGAGKGYIFRVAAQRGVRVYC